MQCLVTGGADEPIALLIQNQRRADTQSAGANLVSFNASAYESYGLSSSINAPVSEYAAFAYGTALNYLLSHSSTTRIWQIPALFIGPRTRTPFIPIGFLLLFPRGVSERSSKQHYRKGYAGLPIAAEGLDPGTPFYVLGLAPNAARIAVRFFLQDTFGNILKNIAAHYKRLEIAKAPYEPDYLTPYWMLLETVHPMSKDSAASPLLAGAVLRAILSNAKYPEALMQNVLLRVHTERSITRGKAAILKAYLLKNHGHDPETKEVAQVFLNEDCTVLPYVLGRLFAALEFIQADSSEAEIGANIKKKYFSTACDTPALIFNELLKQYPVYLNRMKSEGKRIFYSKLVLDAMGRLLRQTNGKPSQPAKQADQCQFLLGYHHQVQRFYQKARRAQRIRPRNSRRERIATEYRKRGRTS